MFIDRFVGLAPRNSLKKALSHFNRGEYGKACKEFEVYVDRGRDGAIGQEQDMIRMYMVESYLGYGKALAHAHKYAEAVEQLERAVAVEPGYADVHFKLATLYEQCGNSDASRAQLQTALDINPGFFRARMLLAQNFYRDGLVEDAIRELTEFLAAAPTFSVEQVKELIHLIRADEEPDKREALFRRLLEEKPSSSQVSKQISLEAIQNGDYDFAVTELKKALSMNPDYPDLHNLLGIAYANKGLTDDAIMEFETALKIHPNYLKAHLNVALTLYEKGANETAMRHLEQVLQLDPENELARNLLTELQPVANKR